MEGKRVLGSRLFLSVLVGLLILNSGFFLYQQRQTRQMGDLWHRQLEIFSDSSQGEVLSWCDTLQQEARDAIWAQAWDYEGEKELQRQMSEELEAQYTYLMGYPDYLKKIEADAKKLQSVSLFADPESVGYKNTVKTAGDFADSIHFFFIFYAEREEIDSISWLF